ncbi:MAG TPA: serpin family protein [Pyrinomonadaceae bacterium]|jgi:serpin B|nr:serpin family protein [Pyrinomonadaceae bacterium]
MKFVLTSLSIAVFVASSLLSPAELRSDASILSVERVVKGNNQFALDLYLKVSRARDGNLFLSPYSLSLALAMIYAGARGETAKQVASVASFPLNQTHLHPVFGSLNQNLKKSVNFQEQLIIANALWKQSGISSKPFVSIIQNHYGSALMDADFAKDPEDSRQTINAWIEQQTKEKIKEILPNGSVDFSTKLLLTNAVYFKAQWAKRFQARDTRTAYFSVTKKESTKVAFMRSIEKFRYYDDGIVQALELPYSGGAFSMMVLLPHKVDGLLDSARWFTQDRLSDIDRSVSQKVIVILPKFNLKDGLELRNTLCEMGMPVAFSRDADFSGIDGLHDLFLSSVIQKSHLTVDEEGTEAAVATGAIGSQISSEDLPVFRADHPFIFIIRDNRSASILFVGRITNPSLS